MGDMTNNRKKYIDAIKGVNILLVIFNHAQGLPTVGSIFTACYMQVFFVLAGYTYRQHKNESIAAFAAGKAKRLLIPYFSYAVAMWLTDSVLERLDLRQVMRGGVRSSLFACQPAAV